MVHLHPISRIQDPGGTLAPHIQDPGTRGYTCTLYPGTTGYTCTLTLHIATSFFSHSPTSLLPYSFTYLTSALLIHQPYLAALPPTSRFPPCSLLTTSPQVSLPLSLPPLLCT